MRGGDNPDADLERGDHSRVLPDLHTDSFRKTPADYRAERVPAEVCAAAESGAPLYISAVPAEASVRTGQDAPAPLSGAADAFRVPHWHVLEGKRLVLPVTSERSELSSFLTRHLWADRPVTLWIPAAGSAPGTAQPGRALSCRVYRNHLVGPVFSETLAFAECFGNRDIAHACELHVLSCRPCTLSGLTVRPAGDLYCQKHLSL